MSLLRGGRGSKITVSPSKTDSQRVALALLIEVSGGGAVADPLEAIACRLGWARPDESDLMRRLGATRVHWWLGAPIDALVRRGFVRRLAEGALLVTWSVS